MGNSPARVSTEPRSAARNSSPHVYYPRRYGSGRKITKNTGVRKRRPGSPVDLPSISTQHVVAVSPNCNRYSPEPALTPSNTRWVWQGARREPGRSESPALRAVVPAGMSMPSRKSKTLRITGQENIVRVEAGASFSSHVCSHPGPELYHEFPTCRVMGVKLPRCLCLH